MGVKSKRIFLYQFLDLEAGRLPQSTYRGAFGKSHFITICDQCGNQLHEVTVCAGRGRRMEGK